MNENDKFLAAKKNVVETIYYSAPFAEQIVLLTNDDDLLAYRAACADSEVVDIANKARLVLIVHNTSADTYITHLEPLD